MSFSYRREVDGLRAIAVVPVIFFHAGFSKFSGGYVGVDIFFVISGFLITSIIKTELNQGSFSLIRFYERRARRILPALFLVIFSCMPFAWFWMSESQFKDFSGSVVDVNLFISNFFFWSNGGYFDMAAETRPLLHTWSLAVEEQFYIFFPVLCILIWRFSRTKMAVYFLLIAVVSLVLSEIGWRYMPSANFYLMPSRAWELLAGALCAFARPQVSAPVRNILALTGLLIVVSAILLFDETTPFPSLLTLIPIGGTVLIILFGVDGTAVARLLSCPALVGIGLISYSAYLWHQPLFAFTRIRSHTVPSENLMLLLTIIVFVLAYLSWRFVERPFRLSAHRGRYYWSVPFGFAAATTLIVFAGVLQQKNPELQNKLYLSQLTAEQQKMYEFLKMHQHGPQRILDNGKCVFLVPSVSDAFEKRFEKCAKSTGKHATVVLGDSHAANIYNALALAQFDSFVVGVSQGGCRPHEIKPNCQYSSFLDFAERHSGTIERILFHQSGSYLMQDRDGRINSFNAFFDDQSYQIAPDNINRIIRYLENLSRLATVIWLGPFVEARIVFGPWLTRERLKFNPHAIRAFKELDNFLLSATMQQSFEFIPINPFLEPLMPSLVIGDCLLARDDDHWSRCGEAIVGDLIRVPLQKL